MSSYELPASASEDVLRGKIAEVRGNMHSLNISNCIVAIPALLLSHASDLRNLQTLSCVACPLKASLLLDRLLTSLQNVTQVNFSLVDAMDDAKEELFKIRHLGIVHAGKETNIRKMYVEVADKHNMEVLLLLLSHCPLLKDLHVHFLHDVSSDSCAATCSSIADHLPNLATFTVTCEAPSTAQSDPRQPVDLRYCIDLHGNAVFRKSPLAFNCAQLRTLVMSPNSTFPTEPVVLVAVDRPDLGFLVGVPRYNLRQLRSLCVLLYARNLDQAVYPTISTTHKAVLRLFFDKLINLVELNVSSFHFDDGVDFTELPNAPALQRLRALSLPPCGLRLEGAVRRLALKLGDVEDLDIRLNLDGRYKSCPSCAKELTIEPVDASAFRIGSGRLTLSNVPNLVSLNFLPHFKMAHLRFVDDTGISRLDYRTLAMALSSSKTLRSLVIRMALINFNEMSFETSLCPASALERLCLLTKTKLPAWKAQMVVEAMVRELPTIFYIHIHYVDRETGSQTRVTWIRRPEGDAAGSSSRPGVMTGKPCIMCSTQTFVALAKPFYRELQ